MLLVFFVWLFVCWFVCFFSSKVLSDFKCGLVLIDGAFCLVTDRVIVCFVL